MNQAMPALLLPPTVRAVSTAPHNLPLANVTCCMRVSLESGRETTSVWAGSPPNRSLQHPFLPLNSSVVVSLMQKPCGVSFVASVPEPGCIAFGGTAYCSTFRILLLSLSAGDAVFSEDVLVSAQTTSCFDVPGPPKPTTGTVASSAAFELRKYSVPRLLF